jgi:hypothetical protein
MLVRVQFRLICPSESDAIQVRDVILDKLATKPVQVTHSDVQAVFKETWLVVGDVSFQLRADADDVYQDTQAKWGGGQLRNRILAGSTVSLHVCSHAQGEPPPWENCRNIDYQLAVKG